MARLLAVLLTDLFYLVMILGLLRRYDANLVWLFLGLSYIASVNIALWIYLDPKRTKERGIWRSLLRFSGWVIVVVGIPGVFQQAVLSGKMSNYVAVVYAAALAAASFYIAGRRDIGRRPLSREADKKGD